jgi:myosin heavy subunit
VTDVATDFSNGVKLIKLLAALWPGTKPKVPYKENPRFPFQIMETRNAALQYARDLGVQFPTTWGETIFGNPATIEELLDCVATSVARMRPVGCQGAARIAILRLEVGKMTMNDQKRTYQREYESRRRLLRSCEAAANNLMNVHDGSEIQAKLRELAQLKSSLKEKEFESLRQQWHQNEETSQKSESSRMAEIDELEGQFNSMISKLDQKSEELEKTLAKWQTVQKMQQELNDLKDKLKKGVQEKRNLLDEWEGFVRSLTDNQNVSSMEAKNQKLQEWEDRLESDTFESLRKLSKEIRELFENMNRLSDEVGMRQPRMMIPRLSEICDAGNRLMEPSFESMVLPDASTISVLGNRLSDMLPRLEQR